MPLVDDWDDARLEGFALDPGAVMLVLAVNPDRVVESLVMYAPDSVRNYLGAPGRIWAAFVDAVGRYGGPAKALADLWWGLDQRGDDLGAGTLVWDAQLGSGGNPLGEAVSPGVRPGLLLLIRHLRAKTRALHGGSWASVTRHRKGAVAMSFVVDAVPFTAAERGEIARWAGESFYYDPKGYAETLRRFLVGLDGDARQEAVRQFGVGILGRAIAEDLVGPAARLTRVAILLRYLLVELGAFGPGEDAINLAEAVYSTLRDALGEEETRAIHQAAKAGWNAQDGAILDRLGWVARVEACVFPEGVILREAWYLWNQDPPNASRHVRHAWSLRNPGTPLCGGKMNYGGMGLGTITRGEAMATRHAKTCVKVCLKCASRLNS